jgi:hypothetical protein
MRAPYIKWRHEKVKELERAKKKNWNNEDIFAQMIKQVYNQMK